jgi:hypothetical protein
MDTIERQEWRVVDDETGATLLTGYYTEAQVREWCAEGEHAECRLVTATPWVRVPDLHTAGGS